MLTTQCYDTELDKELQKLAQEDWAGFVDRIITVKRYTAAKVCIMRERGKSHKQIASKFKKSRAWAQYMNKTKCKCG
jgi:hypothetical protein